MASSTERVLVAMSGGVDSSVAAARLVAEGYDVVGVTLHLWDYPDDGSVRGRCCAPEDVHDARRVADVLGIPHFAFDRRETFQAEVVAPFVDGYLTGTTPSPCVLCNRGVKVRELMHLAERLGAAKVATGHYARLVEEDGAARLHRAHDRSKDQSYFLHMLPKEVLARLLFPLGEATKADVRAEALRLDLPGAQKGESQELCFVPTGRYDAFVEERATDEQLRPGAVVDDTGRTLAEHAGIHRYTVGQRRNLGIGGGGGRRLYVVNIDRDEGTVQLGPREALWVERVDLDDVSLADDVVLPETLEVAVRYRGTPAPAHVTLDAAGAASLQFDPPLREPAVTGQFAVFYRGERVLGGGRIARVSHAKVAPEAASGTASSEVQLS